MISGNEDINLYLLLSHSHLKQMHDYTVMSKNLVTRLKVFALSCTCMYYLLKAKFYHL